VFGVGPFARSIRGRRDDRRTDTARVFRYGGKTGHGAREWLFSNGTAMELGAYDIEVVPLARRK